jgi:hypothetical protein
MQLRETMLVQQNAEITRNIALANQKAQEDVNKRMFSNTSAIKTGSGRILSPYF